MNLFVIPEPVLIIIEVAMMSGWSIFIDEAYMAYDDVTSLLSCCVWYG